MITNVFFGPVVNAARAIAFQVSNAMSSFTGSIVMAIRPPMIKFYAEGDCARVNNYFKFSNKAVFYSLLLILMPIFFEIDIVLKLWLDVDDAQTALFCRLILVYALVLSLNNPIAIIIQATGNIRAYSTYVEIPTLLCFPATWVLYALGMPAQSAFYVMIVSIIISHVIRLVCLKKLFPLFSYRDYVFNFVTPAFAVMFLMAGALFAIVHCLDPGLLRLAIVLALGTITLSVACLLFGFNTNERNTLLSLLKIKRK